MFALTVIGLVGQYYHYLTDTFGALLLAVAVVVGLAVVLDRSAARLAVRAPQPIARYAARTGRCAAASPRHARAHCRAGSSSNAAARRARTRSRARSRTAGACASRCQPSRSRTRAGLRLFSSNDTSCVMASIDPARAASRARLIATARRPLLSAMRAACAPGGDVAVRRAFVQLGDRVGRLGRVRVGHDRGHPAALELLAAAEEVLADVRARRLRVDDRLLGQFDVERIAAFAAGTDPSGG